MGMRTALTAALLLLGFLGCVHRADSSAGQAPGAPPIATAPRGGTIQFTFQNLTPSPARDTEVYITCTAAAPNGGFQRLDKDGTLRPCSPADNVIPHQGRLWADYAIKLSEAPSIRIPMDKPMDSARLYLSVGAPLWIRIDETSGGIVQPAPSNPTDPNNDIIYDWVEFALDRTGFHGNTTCVDQFGMPVTLAVRDRSNPDRLLGPLGIAKSRSSVLADYAAIMPQMFQGLVVPGGYRILAPAQDPRFREGGLGGFFDDYITAMWEKYRREPLVLTPEEGTFTGRVEDDGRLALTRPGDSTRYLIQRKPTTSEVFLCDGVLAQGNSLEKVLGAQIGAMINRHILENPLAWRSPDTYFQAGPSNAYAWFWHTQSLEGKAYGFPYDDVNDQSPSLATAAPMEIIIGFRWD
jgi:hypothetical protein